MDIRKKLLIGLLLSPFVAKAQTLPTVPIYTYLAVGGYAANGNLMNYTDLVTGTWSMQYDGLNRLTGGTANGGPYNSAVLGWSYDSFGNRTAQTVTPSGTAPSAWATYDGNNRMTTNQNAVTPGILSYDSAGNMTTDATNNLLYDAENRVCAVQNRISLQITQYLYDAEGNRVAKGHPATPSSTLYCPTGAGDFTVDEAYVVGQNGEQVSEVDGTGQWKHTNVYAGGQLIATYSQDGSQQALHFNITDALGTKRVQTSYSGVAELDCVNLPFGEGPPCTGATEHFFTGKERDSESGNDYFGARYYASSMGRFMSPDPSGLYFADQTNPQSLNLYSYVLNNPLISVDPDGRECVWDDGSYDSNGDSSTGDGVVDHSGNHTGCSGQGGTWIDHSYFTNNNMADWSSQANKNLADMITPQATVTSGPGTPLSGKFDFGNMTRSQFISMMQQSGIQVSVLDTTLGLHPGLNLRGSQSNCSIHVTLAPFAGQYGNPTTGSFHIDEYNPLTFEPPASGLPLDINGGGMQPTSNMGPHVTQDVIPDLKIQAGMGTWTGNQNCPH